MNWTHATLSRWVFGAVLVLLSSNILVNCTKDGKVNVFSLEDDRQLGAQVDAEIRANPSEYPILPETQYPEAYSHINRITQNILNSGAVKHREDFVWKVAIIRDDATLNAFCTPGGYIYFYTGIIKFLESEDQLAGVMGHEIAHADKRHSTTQMTKTYGVATLLSVLTGGNAGLLGEIAVGLIGLQFSRSDETEADNSSVEYLCGTEYDARGAARFFEKLIEEGQGGGLPQFLSTHPNPDNRVVNIFEQWSNRNCGAGGTFPERYAQFIASLP
jgi:predicted Zn-dependent protease